MLNFMPIKLGLFDLNAQYMWDNISYTTNELCRDIIYKLFKRSVTYTLKSNVVLWRLMDDAVKLIRLYLYWDVKEIINSIA